MNNLVNMGFWTLVDVCFLCLPHDLCGWFGFSFGLDYIFCLYFYLSLVVMLGVFEFLKNDR